MKLITYLHLVLRLKCVKLNLHTVYLLRLVASLQEFMVYLMMLSIIHDNELRSVCRRCSR